MERQQFEWFLEKALDRYSTPKPSADHAIAAAEVAQLRDASFVILESFDPECSSPGNAAEAIADLVFPNNGTTVQIYKGLQSKTVYVIDSDGYFSQGWRLNPSRVQKRLDSYDDGKHSGDTDPFDAPGVTSAEEELIAALSDTRNQLKATEAQILKLTGKLRKVAEIIPDFLD
jgi:hypothetical protein